MPVSYRPPTPNGQCYPQQLRRPFYAGHRSSYLDLIPEEELEAFARMEEIDAPRQKSASDPEADQLKPPPNASNATPMDDGAYANDYLSVHSRSYSGADTPSTPGLSRTTSSSDVSSGFDSFG